MLSTPGYCLGLGEASLSPAAELDIPRSLARVDPALADTHAPELTFEVSSIFRCA